MHAYAYVYVYVYAYVWVWVCVCVCDMPSRLLRTVCFPLCNLHSDILDNVLDLSKLEAGTLKLDLAPIKVKELCSRIHLLLRSTARPNVEFIIDVEPIGLVIEGDHQRWKQLLVNLVSNALKFTHAGR